MEDILIKDIIAEVGGQILSGDINCMISSVATDSRTKMLNGLFIAIKGENTDGHKYIQNAVDNGAVAVIVTDDVEEYIDGVVYIKVEDAIQALKALATWYRGLFDIKAVAITGSVGKTTTKDMIASVLKVKYNVLKTEGNFNSEIGAPLTILRLNTSYDIAVIEMGMDHLGQIYNISSIVKPDTAVITNIGVAHIEYLKTRENILKAKCEVFENMTEDGIAVLNMDDDMLQTVDNSIKKVWVGSNENANIRAKDIFVDYKEGVVKAKVIIKGVEYDISVPGLSTHLISSALLAIGVGTRYDMKMEDIIYGIEHYEHTKMRMDIHKLKNDILLIDDTYNANPVSMKSLIDTVSKSEAQEKILIIGDMFELGEDSVKLHQEVLEYAIGNNITSVILTGSNMKEALFSINNSSKDKIKYFETKEEIYEFLPNILNKNTIIAVKASRGMKFENITSKILEIDNTL